MKLLLFIAFFLVVVEIPPISYGHELLPKDVQEYIQKNPNATLEQIQQFIDKSSPELSKKVKTNEDVLKLLNRETNFIDNALDFLKLGIQHILSGADHILFVISLLLVFVSIPDILKITSTFTLAHSITLILAGSGILTLSSKLVEPIIAFSIAYVAIATVFFKKFSGLKTRVAAVFFFGLFHGLGFAGILKEIQIPKERFISSLFSFNIGIEIGQLIIVSLALPFIYFVKRFVWYNKFIKIVAVIIGILGIIWGIKRLQ